MEAASLSVIRIVADYWTTLPQVYRDVKEFET